jgi:translocation and assembly module TamB
MEKSEVPASKTAAVVKKIFRILLMILGSVFGLLLLILILIQFPFAQNILRKQIQSYVSEKIDTRFEIGKLHIGFPNDIAIEKSYSIQ